MSRQWQYYSYIKTSFYLSSKQQFDKETKWVSYNLTSYLQIPFRVTAIPGIITKVYVKLIKVWSAISTYLA